MIRARGAALVLALGVSACAGFEAVACGGPDDPGAGQTVTTPATLAGYSVQLEPEGTETLNNETDPAGTYQCPGEAAVYSIREGKELRAVLQVSRLAPDARMDDIEFLRGLVRGITGSILEPIEVNGVDIYKTVSQQEVFVTVWFHGRFMFFLTVRQDDAGSGEAVGVDFDALVEEAVLIQPA